MADIELSYAERWQANQNCNLVPAVALAFIIGAILAYWTIHLGCLIIGIIILELIVLGLAWRVWSPLTRLFLVLGSLLGYIFGRWLYGFAICPE